MQASIITINYNNADGLRRTIDSIAPHVSAEIEYIVIDGGSTDRSISYIEEYSDKISYWVSEADKGVYHAMNKGIMAAKGDYILFINSGDILNQNININKIKENLSGEDIVYYNLKVEAPDGSMNFVKEYTAELDFLFFLKDTLPHPASFIKREVLVDYGYYNENNKIVSDWSFFMDAICLRGCSYKYIRECISTFFIDGVSSLSENKAIIKTEKENHIASHYPSFYTLYKEWSDNKDELYKLKSSTSIRFLKKIGLLRWLKL